MRLPDGRVVDRADYNLIAGHLAAGLLRRAAPKIGDLYHLWEVDDWFALTDQRGGHMVPAVKTLIPWNLVPVPARQSYYWKTFTDEKNLAKHAVNPLAIPFVSIEPEVSLVRRVETLGVRYTFTATWRDTETEPDDPALPASVLASGADQPE